MVGYVKVIWKLEWKNGKMDSRWIHETNERSVVAWRISRSETGARGGGLTGEGRGDSQRYVGRRVRVLARGERPRDLVCEIAG